MKCPYCSSTESIVTDKRTSPPGIRRRRECQNCKKRYTTYEKIERTDLYIIKKDKRREKFSREKLEKGIEKSFEKRPVPREEITKLIDEVEEKLWKKGQREIKSSIIGNLVARKIRKLDKIAYIRFASVYKDFEDIQDLKKELKDLQ